MFFYGEKTGVAVMMRIWILAVGGGLWNMCDEQQAHFVPFKVRLKLTLSLLTQHQASVNTLNSCDSVQFGVQNLFRNYT